MHVHLPSSLVGDVRQIRGQEIAAIAEQADGVGPAGGGFSSLLDACWLDTLDRGPYPATVFVEVGDAVRPFWARVLKGDLLAGVVELRRVSLTNGDEYEFDVPCAGCRKPIPWTVRLSQLPVKRLPEASVERVRAGAPFETTVAGRRVLFDLQTLAQEEPVVKLMRQQKRKKTTIVDAVAGQVRRVDGVGPDIRSAWRFLADLSLGELLDLRAAMEEPDCGLETEIEVVCQRKGCEEQQLVNLPLDAGFFSPRRRKKSVSGDEDWAADLVGTPTPSRPASGAASSGGSPASGGGASARTSGGTSTEGAATAD